MDLVTSDTNFKSNVCLICIFLKWLLSLSLYHFFVPFIDSLRIVQFSFCISAHPHCGQFKVPFKFFFIRQTFSSAPPFCACPILMWSTKVPTVVCVGFCDKSVADALA